MHDPSFSHSLPFLGCLPGTFNPSTLHIRSTLLWFTFHPPLLKIAVTLRYPYLPYRVANATILSTRDPLSKSLCRMYLGAPAPAPPPPAASLLSAPVYTPSLPSVPPFNTSSLRVYYWTSFWGAGQWLTARTVVVMDRPSDADFRFLTAVRNDREGRPGMTPPSF